MQREPGKRDYGTSDCARLRSLASRGVPVTPKSTRVFKSPPISVVGSPAQDRPRVPTGQNPGGTSRRR